MFGATAYPHLFELFICWRREWQSTPVFLPGEIHGQRCLVDYSAWGCKELDTTEQLILDYTMSICIYQRVY